MGGTGSDAVVVRPLRLAPGASPPGENGLSLPRAYAERLGVDLATLRWYEADGDAMFPSVRRGDLVVVALRETPVDGAVCLVASKDRASLRRVRARTGGGWVTSCDNPAIRAEEECPVVPVVGVVICVLGAP